MLTIGILITASSASAEPQGTVIKEGALTYPAGPYISEDPLLLSLENYTGNNDIQTLPEQSEITYPNNGSLFLENNSFTITSANLSTCNFRICSSNHCCSNYESNKEIIPSCFTFFCCSPFSFP